MLPSLAQLSLLPAECHTDAPKRACADTQQVLAEDIRRQNYARLVTFATDQSYESAVEVKKVSIGGQAQLGLFASKDLNEKDVVLAYGGPFVPTKSSCASRTHSVFTVNRDVSAEEDKHSVIDGEIVSALFNDEIATDDQKKAVLRISGALMNSSREDPLGRGANVQISKEEDASFKMIDGVNYGVLPFTATRAIRKGEEILWDYAPSDIVRHPLHFYDTTPPPPPPAQPERRRIVPQRV